MELNLRALSEAEIKQVHDRTVTILEEAGVCVKSPRAYEILKAGGAKERGDGILTLSEEMVADALSTAPGAFTLGGRNPDWDLSLPLAETRYGVDGIAPTIRDLNTGVVRDAVKEDVKNIGRVFQTLELGAVAWTGCSALDMPDETHSLHEFAAMLAGTSKHVQFELRSASEAVYAVEILKAVLGDAEAVRRRKIGSVLFCPISPLMLDDSMLDAYLYLADYDVPVNVYPCPIIGLTSPASVFSTICQINAEVLASLTLFQLLRPGLPVLYGSCSGGADKVTGDYFYGDESSMVSAGSIEMARFYQLPNYVAGGGFEDFPNALLRPDLVDGFGTLDNGMVFDMELMVIQHEYAQRVARQLRGVDASSERDLTAELLAAGPGGSFIGKKSTRRNVREGRELYSSKLFPDTLRTTFDELASMRSIANQYIQDILAGPVADPLPEDTEETIARILAEADRKLKGGD